MARPSKEELKKREDARKILDSTFGDLFKVDNKNVVEVAEKLVANNTGANNSWLETQVTELSNKNEELETQLVKAKEDYTRLFEKTKNNSGAQVQVQDMPNDTQIVNGVKAIFDELRMNYEGKNSVRTRYYKADIKMLLDKFLKTFPFLLPK